MHPGSQCTCGGAAGETDPRGPAEQRSGRGGEGTEAHHSFESDVDDSSALADHAAERGEHERRREFQHGGE